MLFVLLGVAVVACVLGGVHFYLWRRLVRDVSVPGGWWRRTGTVLAFALPMVTVATFVSGRANAPFAVERALAWPGYMWLALMIYLLLSLVAGELLRPLLRRALAAYARRGGGRQESAGSAVSGAGVPARSAAEGRAAEGAGLEGDAPSSSRRGGGRPEPDGPAVTREAVPAQSAEVEAEGDAPSSARRSGGRPDADGPAVAGAGVPAHSVADEHAAEGAGAERDAPSLPRRGGGRPEPDGPAVSREAVPAQSAEVEAEGDAPSSARRGGEGPEPDGPAVTREPDAVDVSRRKAISRGVAIGAGLVAGTAVASGAYGVLNGPTLKRVTVPLAKLPRAAHGYRIAVVSDMHLGPILGRSHTQRVVDLINRTQPDMVAIVGDLVDGTVDDLGPAADPLRALRSRHGTFFVTGNHEYFGEPRPWIEHLRGMGVHPLENARRELPHFDLAGVNDVQGEESGQGPDFGKALGGRDTSRASVLLAHQPVQIHDAVDHGVDLQLSGHTHGGQLWPGPYLAALANPTVAGLERYGDTALYVTRGAGAWGPPVRVGADSDMTVVELASKQA